jgi:hypothetical protein
MKHLLLPLTFYYFLLMGLGLITYSLINKIDLGLSKKIKQTKVQSKFLDLRGKREYSKAASWPLRHARR